jgi:hypothetical protein
MEKPHIFGSLDTFPRNLWRDTKLRASRHGGVFQLQWITVAAWILAQNAQDTHSQSSEFSDSARALRRA